MKRVCIRKLRYLGNVEYVGREVRGRIKGSVLGNRWKVGKDGSRDEVIEKYRRWLWEEVKKEEGEVCDELMRLLSKGDKLVIGCWCFEDERCHGDAILRCLEWIKSVNRFGGG
jgi:hypothetical protein